MGETPPPSPRPAHTRNVGRYYLFHFLFGAAVNSLVSVLVLFWLDRGLSLGQTMILMSSFGISHLVFEIPTGGLADRYSRKWSLSIGSLLHTVVGLIILSTTIFPILLGAYVLVGIAVAFASGSGEALIYDSLKRAGRAEDAQHVFGNGLSAFHAGGVIGAVTTGLLVARFDLSSSVWTYSILWLIAAAVALSFNEPPFPNNTKMDTKTSSPSSPLSVLLANTRSSFGILTIDRSLTVLIGAGATIIVTSSLAQIPFSQPYLVGFGLGPEQVAYIWASFSAAAAVVAALSNRLSKLLRGDERRFIVMASTATGIGVTAMVSAPSAALAIASLLLMFVGANGLAPPFMNSGINRRIPSTHRASILSVSSTCFGLTTFLAAPLFGFLADGYSIGISLRIFQCTFILLLAVATYIAWRLMAVDDEHTKT